MFGHPSLIALYPVCRSFVPNRLNEPPTLRESTLNPVLRARLHDDLTLSFVKEYAKMQLPSETSKGADYLKNIIES
ncbi:MAG TPA: hypothetical protein VE779_10845, partial [Candidatus Angelobacter sp.]|nr:hypothetical protein [Candidatus Angelobacter sp.]